MTPLLADAPPLEDIDILRAKEDLFWAMVEAGEPDECWLWLGFIAKSGYGQVKRSGKTLYAHRVAFTLHHGRAPEMVVVHSCDNPPCCNPAHLGDSSYRANTHEAMARGRLARGERVGGAFLTQEIADEIRQLYAAGGVSQAELAVRFNTKQPNISKIVRGESWAR